MRRAYRAKVWGSVVVVVVVEVVGSTALAIDVLSYPTLFWAAPPLASHSSSTQCGVSTYKANAPRL